MLACIALIGSIVFIVGLACVLPMPTPFGILLLWALVCLGFGFLIATTLYDEAMSRQHIVSLGGP